MNVRKRRKYLVRPLKPRNRPGITGGTEIFRIPPDWEVSWCARWPRSPPPRPLPTCQSLDPALASARVSASKSILPAQYRGIPRGREIGRGETEDSLAGVRHGCPAGRTLRACGSRFRAFTGWMKVGHDPSGSCPSDFRETSPCAQSTGGAGSNRSGTPLFGFPTWSSSTMTSRDLASCLGTSGYSRYQGEFGWSPDGWVR